MNIVLVQAVFEFTSLMDDVALLSLAFAVTFYECMMFALHSVLPQIYDVCKNGVLLTLLRSSFVNPFDQLYVIKSVG